ncbi:flagellar hook-length control protein FliK [Paenibacillus sp. S150]|uniref:flagellar hook-length control protein FliK n=1 Tax=Paenibacillus sp. S150 TaxID=2749826 RepID=UPI001C56F471|nr:flagellar hook-length control protein FliK [Paenibacillus sp. S150]MBW4083247.1 flagellar hook-length control protein FliK [Paenibacillus sp. S150]
MSLVVQTMAAGNTAASGGAATAANAATAAASGKATLLPFAQTLVQSMEGAAGAAAKGTETPIPGNLAALLQGLMNAVQAAGEETEGAGGSRNTGQVQELTEDLARLDESISSDPVLLAALQGWLVQVSALLPGSSPSDGTVEAEAGTNTAALSPLARNPETLRFAVQDELNSLVNMIQQAAAGGDEQAASQGVRLLNNFTAILAETAVPESRAKGKTTVSTEAPAVSLAAPAGTETNSGSKVKTPAQPDIRLGISSAVKPETAAAKVIPADDAGSEAVSTPPARAAGKAETPASSATAEPLTEATAGNEEHEVVTAGQLSLRGGITAPLKAEAAPVPVPQFAQEMESFITGKLDIVKKGGVAEATITLFPENLGQVDVKITMQNGHLVASFLTEHAAAKDMLEQQMSQLRSALQSHGLQVEKLEVTQNNTPLQAQYNGQQGRGSGGQQQERRSKERSEDIGDAVLAAELNGEWKEWVAGAQADHREQGGSFSAKA